MRVRFQMNDTEKVQSQNSFLKAQGLITILMAKKSPEDFNVNSRE